MPPLNAARELIAVTITGADARAFMQGQLTCDVRKVSEKRAAWGALCTGQGRVQSLFTLAAREDHLVALLPSALCEGVLSRLKAFTLSSKVAFERLPWAAMPVTEAEIRELAGEVPAEPGDCRVAAELILLRWWGSTARYLCIGPRERLPALGDEELTARKRTFRRTDVEAGVPEVFRETQGLFVPQTLNLDLLGGVSFDKGCYVGQEVVARARRGGVPRRLFGFSAQCAAPPPSTVVTFEDQEVGCVVDAVGSDAGCELLAVVELDRARSRLRLRDQAASELAARSLPYAVPLERR
jgi:folate-binding protein YgfZ